MTIFCHHISCNCHVDYSQLYDVNIILFFFIAHLLFSFEWGFFFHFFCIAEMSKLILQASRITCQKLFHYHNIHILAVRGFLQISLFYVIPTATIIILALH